jgi:outer membrane protein OmpU
MSADLYCASNSIVTYQRLSEKRGCGKAASFSGAIIGQCLEGLQSQPRTGETLPIPIPESPVRAKFFQPEGKLMKNVLFATTALVASAGIASAEFAMSASAKLSYGNYGTGIYNNETTSGAASTAAGDSTWGSEADVVVTMTGGGDTVSYSAALEIDEAGSPTAGPVSITTSGVTVTYDANDISDITAAGADGEDDNKGDIKVSYAGGGLSASYVADLDDATDLGYVVNLGYAEGDVSLGLETDGTTSEVAVGYSMGDIAFAASANNDSDWDVSVAYTLGVSTITVATDEDSVSTVALATTLNGLTLGAKTGDDNEFSVGYAADAFGFAIAYDSGNSGFGDEAETTLVVDYAIDGMGFQLKANNQSEMEISSSLSF